MFLGQSTITPSPWIKSCKGLLGFALFADKFFMSVATFDVHPCNQFYTLNSIFSMLFSGCTKTLMSRNACNGENGENSPGSGDLNWMPKVAPWRLAILANWRFCWKSAEGWRYPECGNVSPIIVRWGGPRNLQNLHLCQWNKCSQL